MTSSQTEATKSVVIGGLALPSVNQLLAGLGVDLNALLNQLTQGNLDKLGGLVGANLATLNSAVDTAQAALTSAGQTAADSLATAQQAKTAAASAATAAQTAVNTAQTAATTADGAWTTAVSSLSGTLTTLGLPTNLAGSAFSSGAYFKRRRHADDHAQRPVNAGRVGEVFLKALDRLQQPFLWAAFAKVIRWITE